METYRTGIERLRTPLVAFTIATFAAVAILIAFPGMGDAPKMVSLTIFCIILWILTPIPPAYTGLIGIGLIGVVFSTDLALTGFQKPATWLIGFGLLIGEATRQSGLADWTGDSLTVWAVPTSAVDQPRRIYRRVLVALSLGAHALAFFVPSSLVRVLIILPVLNEASERFESQDARIGVVLGPALATFYGSTGILTADIPNIMISGFGESIADHQLSWTEWWLHMYPVMGITRVLIICCVVYFLFRPDTNSDVDLPNAPRGGSAATERRMLAFLLVGTGIWMTDFVHGFHPVIGAIVVVVLVSLPDIGVAGFQELSDNIDFSILFFIAAVFAIGDGLSATGFTDAAAEYLLAVIPADAPLAVSLGVVFAITVLLVFAVEVLAVASVLTPVLIPYAEATGLPLTPVLLVETMALSIHVFPYQSAVLVVILSADAITTRDLVRTTTVCSLATVAVLFPLQLGIFLLSY